MVAKIVQQFTYWPIYLTFKILCRYKIEGQENLKGLEDKPVIFASNHASYIDGPICAAAMPREGLVPKSFFPVRFLAAKEYYEFRNPKNFPFPISLFTTAYVRINGCVPVERGGMKSLEEKLGAAVRALKEEKIKLWIYPEGRITRDGNLQSGKAGAVYLHQATGAAIVPVGLIGAFKILSFPPLIRRRVKVKIGKPIYSLNDNLEGGAEKVIKAIAELLK
jgi:1-acyl-sn-glycerol-3-phosphate acyltransferase